MSKRNIIFCNTTTPEGRRAFEIAYQAKHGPVAAWNKPNRAAKMAAQPPPVGFKPLLPAERGKLGVCPSTRLEAFKATPFPGSFKLGLKQRLHRWLCDECGFWHGQVVNPDEDNLPPEELPSDSETENALNQMPARQPSPDVKWPRCAGGRAGKLSKKHK